jgi:hypothetical protein
MSERKEAQPSRDPDQISENKWDYPDGNIPNEVLAILPDAEGRPDNFQQKAAELLTKSNEEHIYYTKEAVGKLKTMAKEGVGKYDDQSYKDWQPADLLALANSLEQHPLYQEKVKEGERREAIADTINDWENGDESHKEFRKTKEVPAEVTVAIADQIVTQYGDALLKNKNNRQERFELPESSKESAYKAVERMYGERTAQKLDDSRAEDSLELKQAWGFREELKNIVDQDPRMIALGKEAEQLKAFAKRADALKAEARKLTQDELVQQGLDSRSVQRRRAELLRAHGLDDNSISIKKIEVESIAFRTVEENRGEKLADLSDKYL